VKALAGAAAGDEPSRERLLEQEFGILRQAELKERQLNLALVRACGSRLTATITVLVRSPMSRISENIRVRATEKAQAEKFVQRRVVAPEPRKLSTSSDALLAGETASSHRRVADRPRIDAGSKSRT